MFFDMILFAPQKEKIDMNMNNINEKIANFRDIFLESEKDRVKHLKINPRFNTLVRKLNAECSAEKLYGNALVSMKKIELGQVKEKDLEKEEFNMLASLSAIVDYPKIRIKERVF